MIDCDLECVICPFNFLEFDSMNSLHAVVNKVFHPFRLIVRQIECQLICPTGPLLVDCLSTSPYRVIYFDQSKSNRMEELADHAAAQKAADHHNEPNKKVWELPWTPGPTGRLAASLG